MSALNVSFMPWEGSLPSGLHWAKLCCGIFSLSKGAWMGQECTEERRAGQCNTAGWGSTAGHSCSTLPLLESSGWCKLGNLEKKHGHESFPPGWSQILALSLYKSFNEAPSPAPSFFWQTGIGMTVEKTTMETHALVVPQAEIRRNLINELLFHPN